MKTCNLCKQQAPLQKSHIVPRFLFNWLRKTSATGFVRSGKQPNQRIQDGWKSPFLCRDCEKLFNSWETDFANKIFYKFIDDKINRFDYEEWLLQFCVSVSWRAINYMDSIEQLKDFDVETVGNVNKAISKWGRYLIDSQSASETDLNQHLYFVHGMCQ